MSFNAVSVDVEYLLATFGTKNGSLLTRQQLYVLNQNRVYSYGLISKQLQELTVYYYFKLQFGANLQYFI